MHGPPLFHVQADRHDGPEQEAAYNHIIAATSYAAIGFMPSLESMNSAPAALSSSYLCREFSMGLRGEIGSNDTDVMLQPQGSVVDSVMQALRCSACMSQPTAPPPFTLSFRQFRRQGLLVSNKLEVLACRSMPVKLAGMSATRMDLDGLLMDAVGQRDSSYPHSQPGPRGKAERRCSRCGASSAETPRSGVATWHDSCCVRVYGLQGSAQCNHRVALCCKFRSGPDGQPLCNGGDASMDRHSGCLWPSLDERHHPVAGLWVAVTLKAEAQKKALAGG